MRHPLTLSWLGTNRAARDVSGWAELIWQNHANPDVGFVLSEGILVPNNEGFTGLQGAGLVQVSQASGQISSGPHFVRGVVEWGIWDFTNHFR